MAGTVETAGVTRREFVGCLAAAAAGEAFAGGAAAAGAPVFADDAAYLKAKFRRDVTDPATGLDADALVKGVAEVVRAWKDVEPWPVVKARAYAFVTDRMAIDASAHDWFPAFACWDRRNRPLAPMLRARNAEVDRAHFREVNARCAAGAAAGRHTMWKDYDHSVPDWDDILALGFPGMKARLRAHWQDTPYYRACELTIDATIRCVRRLAAKARAGAGASARLRREAESLERLAAGAPATVYDVMLFTYLYFIFSEHVDHLQVRSLGNLDRLWMPYYAADLAAGRTTEAEFREQFRHFIWQWGSIDNYWGQPAYMGGTKADGATEYNALSRVMLDVLDAEALPTPKFQFKIAANTPRDIYDRLLDMARRQRSLVLCGEKGMTRAMKAAGYTDEECRTCVMRGCYEFVPRRGANSTGPGYVNLLKPLEEVLKGEGTRDEGIGNWEEFLEAYCTRLRENTVACREIAAAWEARLDEINPTNLFSMTVEHSVRTGKDAFFNGTASCNHTSILCAGLGTTVDALLAVKELVYETRALTLRELAAVMAADWKEHEALRLRMLRSRRKWGNNDAEANALGARVAKTFTGCLNGVPNTRGGHFQASGHSARQFLVFGTKTGATPDGRKAGEEISKNLSPTMGADTEGVTALVRTVAALDSADWPGDFPLDVMFHPSAVSGAAGLDAMRALTEVYFANDGCAVHFNVFSVETLRDAQAHPGRYANLQVRVCGWNVRWNDMPRVEQEAYIRRAERVGF